MVEGILSLILD